jgi:hypothetical protein
MGVSAQSLRLGLALCAVAALAGCDKPKPRPPAGAPVPGAAPAASTSTIPAGRQNPGALPALPAWASGLLGKPMRASFPNDGACIGNTDNLEMSVTGTPAGSKIVGWGWEEGVKAPVAKVVLVDRDMTVVGAGETGLARPDVTRARPDITSNTTGWAALTSLTHGSLDTYGLLADGKSVCKLGHIEF